MPVVKEFLELLENAKATHEKKNTDYAAISPFENFERCAEVMSWFKHDIDKAFACLVTVKLARLATLLNKNEPPNNESVEDSFLDLFVYSGLCGSYHKSKGGKVTLAQTYPTTMPLITRDCIHKNKKFLVNEVHGSSQCLDCGMVLHG